MVETYKGSIKIGINHFSNSYGAVHEGDKALMEYLLWVLMEMMSEMLKEWGDSRAEDWGLGLGLGGICSDAEVRRKGAKPARKPSWYPRTGSIYDFKQLDQLPQTLVCVCCMFLFLFSFQSACSYPLTIFPYFLLICIYYIYTLLSVAKSFSSSVLLTF